MNSKEANLDLTVKLLVAINDLKTAVDYRSDSLAGTPEETTKLQALVNAVQGLQKIV